MKLLITSSLILCCLALHGCSDEPDDSMNGNTNGNSSLPLAPNFTLLNTDLEETMLVDYSGKVVISSAKPSYSTNTMFL